MIVLGFHGGVTLGQHEASAALIIDGKVVACCEEERYLRQKSAYGRLPRYSIKACLEIAGIAFEDIDLVIAPGITYGDFEERIRDYLRHTFGSCPQIERVHHQEAHVAAAFYGSGYDDALCLSLDASGDGACGILARASRDGGIEIIEEIPTRNSIGYFYTLMTYYLGFGDDDEYKVMGLAPYGKPTVDLTHIIKPRDGGWDFDWSFVRNDPKPRSPFEPIYAAKITEHLKRPPRLPGSQMTQYYKDVACSTQAAMETSLLHVVKGLKAHAPEAKNFCYAGGVALNCAANNMLLRSGLFENYYVSPLSSDRGLALGCAYLGAVRGGDGAWPIWNVYLGSSYSNDVIIGELKSNGVAFEETDDPSGAAAKMLAERAIVGWYQGRSEAGARALGNRSIIASCSDPDMKDKVNARIKYREEFRPFAPSVMQEYAGTYFESGGKDFPYMCFTLEAVKGKVDSIRAVVHEDNTARVQTVRSSDNELYYDLIQEYESETGVPAILNTSFNLKGQPIVETPRDALMTFFGCGLDALIMGNFIVKKTQ